MREQRVTLDAIQQSRIEALARSKGLACGVCGSRDLFSGEAAHRIFRHGAQEFALSPEEALRVGLG